MWNGSDGTARRVSLKDIQIVQNLTEQCLELFIIRVEVASTLLAQGKIEPGFTQLVWKKLEEENREFFEDYCLRLAVKNQVMGCNELLNRHWQLTQKIISSIPSMSTSNGSHDIPLKTQSIWFLLSALASIWIFVVFRGGANKNACARCKYQRRRCDKACLMAPYFPGDRPDDLKEDAVKSIIYESLIRERLCARGCQGYINQLKYHVICHQRELDLVRARHALYRGQSDKGHAGATAFGFSPCYTSEHMVLAVNHATGFSLQNNGGLSLVPTMHSTVAMSVHASGMHVDAVNPVQSSNMSSTQGLNGSVMRSETGYSVGSQYMFSPDGNFVGAHPPLDTTPHQDLREPFVGSHQSDLEKLVAEFPRTSQSQLLMSPRVQTCCSRANFQVTENAKKERIKVLIFRGT